MHKARHIAFACLIASLSLIGGSALARWFAEQAGLNNPVDIDILAPNAVWLRNPETVFK